MEQLVTYAAHCRDCVTCIKNGECHLQQLTHRMGVHSIRFRNTREAQPIDISSPSIVRDPNKCILCGDCVRMCADVQGVNAPATMSMDFGPFEMALQQELPAQFDDYLTAHNIDPQSFYDGFLAQINACIADYLTMTGVTRQTSHQSFPT